MLFGDSYLRRIRGEAERDAVTTRLGSFRAFRDRSVQRSPGYSLIVQVRNDGSDDWQKYDVVGVCGSVSSSIAGAVEVEDLSPFRGCRLDDYSFDGGRNRMLGITQEPIARGETGNVCVRGVTPAKTVDYYSAAQAWSSSSEWLRVVYASNGNKWSLAPGRSGDVRILKYWLDPSVTTDNTYALVDVCEVPNRLQLSTSATSATISARSCVAGKIDDGQRRVGEIPSSLYTIADNTADMPSKLQFLFSPDWDVPKGKGAWFYLPTSTMPAVGRKANGTTMKELCGPCPSQSAVWPGLPGFYYQADLSGCATINSETLAWFGCAEHAWFYVQLTQIANLTCKGKILAIPGGRYDGSGIYPDIDATVVFDPNWIARGNNTSLGRHVEPNAPSGTIVRCRITTASQYVGGGGTQDARIVADDPCVWDEPIGTIRPFYVGISGAAAVPYGWRICDGSHSTPDLRGKFLKGVAGSEWPGAMGGGMHTTACVAGGTKNVADANANSGTEFLPPFFAVHFIIRTNAP